MNKTADRKKLVIVCCAAFAVLAVAVLLAARVPQRLTARQINAGTDLPYGFLSDTDYAREGLICVECFGIKGFYDSKYVPEDAAPDAAADFPDKAVIYYTASWPDTVFGSHKTVRIECPDPAYRLFGCAVGDTYSDFHNALKEAGFREVGYGRYEKWGISVTLELNTTIVNSFTISTQSANLLGVQY